MGFTYVTVLITKDVASKRGYRAEFLVDSGAADSLAPASQLRKAGIKPVGRATYKVGENTRKLQFGSATFRFMGEITAGRIIFGDEGAEPLLGFTVLESVGIVLDPATKTLKRSSGHSLEVNSSLSLAIPVLWG